MFEEIQKEFYESLVKSIKARKKDLELTRDDILPDPKRITNILKKTSDARHPYLIGRDEYPRLIHLFLCEDKESFVNVNVLDREQLEELRKNCNNNYDKMLWEHCNWDKMFEDIIKELSESDRSEGLGRIFEDTLTDYAPYAAIKKEGLHPKYAIVYIFPDEEERKRQDAIKWVHLRHGSRLFKQTFYKRFSGKTLCEFYTEFHEFVTDYLKERNAKDYSFGAQTYSFHQSFSRIVMHWQSLPEVQYGDIGDEKSELQILLEEYKKYGEKHMKKLEEYQRKFDKLHIDNE